MKLRHPLVRDDIALRTLEPEDVTTSYLAWLNDAAVNRYLEVRFAPPQSLTELRSFVAAVNASADSLLLGVFLPSGKHIGNIKMGPIDAHHATADVGLIIGDRAEWGKGYAQAAISLLSEYAFEALQIAKLTAGCYADNEGSTKAFLRAGYAIEGRRVAQWRVEDRRVDGVLLGKVNPSERP